jgi:hypothetical protein
MSRRKEPEIPPDLLDQLLAGGDAAAALQQGGLLDSLKKALAERALNAEMDHHLGHEEQAGNSRNGIVNPNPKFSRMRFAHDPPPRRVNHKFLPKGFQRSTFSAGPSSQIEFAFHVVPNSPKGGI